MQCWFDKTELKNPSDICVAVCVKNSEHTIGACLSSIMENNPGQILVVDGDSTDQTKAIVEKDYKLKTVSDRGLGLAHARKVATDSALKPFILFIGPDNILPAQFITHLITSYRESHFDAVSVQTRVANPQNFWDRGQDFRWEQLMKSGPVKVLGTPSLYPTGLLRHIGFSSNNFGPSDDTDLGQRLIEQQTQLGVVPVATLENGNQTFKETWRRYKWYGTGDSFFFKDRKATWTLGRKIRSLLHPALQCWQFAKAAISQRRYSVVAWLLLTTTARYCGWVMGK